MVIAEDGTRVLRALTEGDGAALADAYRRNREALASWEPLRDEEFFSDEAQTRSLRRRLADRDAGRALPFIVCQGEEVVGLFNMAAIERGTFLNARLGYWVDEAERGKGIARWAVGAIVTEARDVLGLHRLEAATLPHNEPSQRVLAANGFERIGIARAYLQIAGAWQDHVLFQRIL